MYKLVSLEEFLEDEEEEGIYVFKFNAIVEERFTQSKSIEHKKQVLLVKEVKVIINDSDNDDYDSDYEDGEEIIKSEYYILFNVVTPTPYSSDKFPELTRAFKELRLNAWYYVSRFRIDYVLNQSNDSLDFL